MKNSIKIFIVLLFGISLCGCSFPFQSHNYPSWKTNGILEAYTLTDGRLVDGWLGTKIGNIVNSKWFDFTINYCEITNEYDGYKAGNDKKLVHASISITNTSDKVVYLVKDDFVLVWNLDKNERSYTYSLEPYSSDMLSDDVSINVGETKIIHVVYEIDKHINETMAIYYYEQYSDGQKGNKFYVYIN